MRDINPSKNVYSTVSKQSMYGVNITAFSSMNPVHKFYHELLRFLREKQDTVSGRESLIALAKKTPNLSCNVTSQSLSDMHFICMNAHRSEEIFREIGEIEERTSDKFILAAFKDLSPMKNPHALGIFTALNEMSGYNAFLTLFARKVIRREDGSAVLVMHVSNFEKFEKFLDRQSMALHTTSGIEEGMQINF